jgi:hypothetical protein
MPPNGKGLRYDVPIPGRLLVSVTCPQTGTLAFEPSSIPAGGRADLLFAVGLDDIDAAEVMEALGHHVFKP